MAESSKEPKFSLRLVVDEEKKKVVLVEACRDFVDVLFSFLTLPMGTIVRLLEKHRKSESVTVGCFSNLYKSVVDMGIDDFETEACKEMLLYPRSVREVECKRLKLNINPVEDVKFFKCSNFENCNLCSNFSTCRCQCGRLMNQEIYLPDENENRRNESNGVFVRGIRSSFIITDDLKVAVKSTDVILKKLKSLGSADIKLGERLVNVGFKEVMTLLQCIFSSNTPLTDAFLNKQIPQGMMKTCKMLSPCMKRKRDEAEEVITLSVILRKHDMKVLHVESGEDFVDLLFTYLAVPLESVLEISGNSFTFGCIGNLFTSFKDFSATTSKSVLPHYYRCQKQLLDIITDQPPLYYRCLYIYFGVVVGLTTNYNQASEDNINPVVLVDPKSHRNEHQLTEGGSGFVKRDTKFTVSDDLVVTPMTTTSAFCLLKKFQIQADDVEVRELSISKTEATNLLRASLVTSSALNTALRNLVLKKKPKEET